MPFIGELISLGTALCWTITVVSFEYAGKKVGSISVNVIRLVFGFILLGISLYIFRGSFIPLDASVDAWRLLLISGLIGLVIGDLFLFQAFVDVGGRISLLIMSMVPIISTILSFFIIGEVLRPYEFLGMAVTLSGIFMVLLMKRKKDIRFDRNVTRGIVFALIGAFAQAIGLIFSKQGMGDYNAFAATQIRIIGATFGFILFLLIRREFQPVVRAFHNKKAMTFIVIGSIFGPFLGVSSSLLAMQYTEIGIATTIAQTNVILIIPFSILLFHDDVSKKEIVGSVIAFIGVAILFLS